jgi:hypothetical protein
LFSMSVLSEMPSGVGEICKLKDSHAEVRRIFWFESQLMRFQKNIQNQIHT